MDDNRALLDRERGSSEQKISALQKEIDRLRTEGYAKNQELEARALDLQNKQTELQNTLEMVRQATATSDASYERAVEEQHRLHEPPPALRSAPIVPARFNTRSLSLHPSRPAPYCQRGPYPLPPYAPVAAVYGSPSPTLKVVNPIGPTTTTDTAYTLPPPATATATYGYPYPATYPLSGTYPSGSDKMGPDRGSGGGGGSPPPNPPNPPSYPIPAPAPAPRDRSPDSRYADCKKFVPTLDSLEHRRFLEFFLRRFDELAAEYRLSEEQLLLVFGDRLVSSKIERAADWWMRLHEKESHLSWAFVKELFRQEFIVQTSSQTYGKIMQPNRRENESIRSFIWRLNDSHQEAGSDAPIIIQGIIEGYGDSAISNLLRQRRPRPRSAKECIRLLTDCEFDIDSCPNGSRSASKTGNSAPTPSTPTRSPRQTSKSTDNSESVILQTIKDLKTELRADMLTLASRNDATYSTQSQLAALSTSVAPIAVTPNTPVPPRICMEADDICGNMTRCGRFRHGRNECHWASSTCSRCNTYGHSIWECGIPEDARGPSHQYDNTRPEARSRTAIVTADRTKIRTQPINQPQQHTHDARSRDLLDSAPMSRRSPLVGRLPYKPAPATSVSRDPVPAAGSGKYTVEPPDKTPNLPNYTCLPDRPIAVTTFLPDIPEPQHTLHPDSPTSPTSPLASKTSPSVLGRNIAHDLPYAQAKALTDSRHPALCSNLATISEEYDYEPTDSIPDQRSQQAPSQEHAEEKTPMYELHPASSSHRAPAHDRVLPISAVTLHEDLPVLGREYEAPLPHVSLTARGRNLLGCLEFPTSTSGRLFTSPDRGHTFGRFPWSPRYAFTRLRRLDVSDLSRRHTAPITSYTLASPSPARRYLTSHGASPRAPDHPRGLTLTTIPSTTG
ncbi:hypothetical protein AC1031_007845 [Aphanomyces cochlioides]|nr:hypothetical protein AC1031_007845 [Aphanomyces cochlioides]